MLIKDLSRSQIEILLRDVHSPFPESVHAGFGADAFEFGAGTAVHFFGYFGEVDASCEVHGAGVDSEDVGSGFDAVGGGYW